MDLYHAYHINSTEEYVIGVLSQFDFEAFEENEDHIVAYIKSHNLTDEVKRNIEDTLNQFDVSFSLLQMEDKNWNEIWESNFQPVYVDNFCQIRADFHPPIEGFKHDIVINPKMAFGTGHHATTYMMISQMETMDVSNKRVFDFGCGTGILAIMASMLGADPIDAVDIEIESYENTIENAKINTIANITTYYGDLDVVPSMTYPIILANINRNILLKYASELSDRTEPNGYILLSGILVEDQDVIVSAYAEYGFEMIKAMDKDNWKCLLLQKK